MEKEQFTACDCKPRFGNELNQGTPSFRNNRVWHLAEVPFPFSPLFFIFPSLEPLQRRVGKHPFLQIKCALYNFIEVNL